MTNPEPDAWLTLRLHAKSADAAMKMMLAITKREKLLAFKSSEKGLVYDLMTDSRTAPTNVGTAHIQVMRDA